MTTFPLYTVHARRECFTEKEKDASAKLHKLHSGDRCLFTEKPVDYEQAMHKQNVERWIKMEDELARAQNKKILRSRWIYPRSNVITTRLCSTRKGYTQSLGGKLNQAFHPL